MLEQDLHGSDHNTEPAGVQEVTPELGQHSQCSV